MSSDEPTSPNNAGAWHNVVSRRSADDERDDLADVLRFPSNQPAPEADLVDVRLRDVLGEVLRDERHRQDRVLADVADAASVSLQYLSEVERGQKEISSDLLAAVTVALDVALVEVLDRCVRRLRARSQGGSRIQLRAA